MSFTENFEELDHKHINACPESTHISINYQNIISQHKFIVYCRHLVIYGESPASSRYRIREGKNMHPVLAINQLAH